MKKTFSAFRNDGSKVMLCDVLARIPQNDLTWCILDFSGIGVAPGGVRMEDFEQLTESQGGVAMDWPQLTAFAATLEDVSDCVIVGGAVADARVRQRIDHGDVAGLEVVIRLADSTDWTIWTPNSKRVASRMRFNDEAD